jgi:hypothetical protein
MFNFLKKKVTEEKEEIIVDRTTIDGFHELRAKYPSRTITYKITDIIPDISNLQFTKAGVSLVYDAMLEFAEKNNLQFLGFTVFPNTCSLVTFIKTLCQDQKV